MKREILKNENIISKVVILLDTSGSIDIDISKRSLSETLKKLEEYKLTISVDVIKFSNQSNGIEKFINISDFNLTNEFPGYYEGGSTDIDYAIRHIKRNYNLKDTWFILISDFYNYVKENIDSLIMSGINIGVPNSSSLGELNKIRIANIY